MIDNRRFISDINEGVDELDMSAVLNQDLKAVLSTLADYPDFDIEKIFEYRLYGNSKLLPRTSYEIDYKNHLLLNRHPSSNITYTIVLYGNVKRLNEINDLILANKRHLIHKLLRNIMVEGK